MEKHEIKNKDVFSARFTDGYKEKNKGWDLHRCFEGILIAKEVGNRENDATDLWLFDTYWNVFGGGGGKYFKLDAIGRDIELTFIGNLDDYDTSVNMFRTKSMYDENDYIYLHNQHACADSCKYVYLKKGATKSAEAILRALNSKKEYFERKIKSAQSSLEWLEKDYEHLKNMELDEIYI